jgi:hypothetical protein
MARNFERLLKVNIAHESVPGFLAGVIHRVRANVNDCGARLDPVTSYLYSKASSVHFNQNTEHMDKNSPAAKTKSNERRGADASQSQP